MLHGGSALICAAWTLMILLVGRGRLTLLLGASGATAALWAGAVALAPEGPSGAAPEGLAGAFEVLRSAVWLGALAWLCREVGGQRARTLTLWAGGAGLLMALLGLAALLPDVAAALTLPTFGPLALIPRLALALLVVLMAENLYRNAGEAARWHVVLPCIALGGLSALDVILYADAVLSRGFSQSLMDARAVMTAMAAPLLAIAAVRDRRLRRDLPVSREFAVHGATLMVAGTFLLAVGAASEALRQLGEPWVAVAQIAILAGAVMALAVALSARSVRSRLRRAMADPFFRARYDYRREWLRCIATLSLPDAPADARAVRALADAVDSPAGVLLLRDDEGTARMRWAGGWNADPTQPGPGVEAALRAALRDGQWVAHPAPEALHALLPRLWLAVPLMHHRDGLTGAVLLAFPRAPFALDREVFDLLRMLGREVAMFLAERRGAERLAEQVQLEAYAKRFAFVAHDVKTVAHQLTMLLDNANTHISDPEFQQDMLMTVRASADRINTLIARLRTPGEDARPGPPHSTDVLARLRVLARRRAHPVIIEAEEAPTIRIPMPPDQFETAVTHLLDNAAEASPAGAPVRLRLLLQAGRPILEITDEGPGMSADFVRDALFRPLTTSKLQGNGIGAWQARELLRRAGGELEVITDTGRGTTMRMLLPARDAAEAGTRQLAPRGLAAE